MNKFICVCFVFYPRKPHPKGNKYHIICCGEIGIMYGWENIERRGNLIPMERLQFETSTNMKIVELMLQLNRALWSTGKSVIMEIMLCLLKELLLMIKWGCYESALIKKRRYWTKGVHGYDIN